MGRVPLAGAMVVAWMGTAHAGPTRKVTVATEPPGATVYLNDTESGAVCDATPCTIDVPIGQTPIIVQLKNYGPVVDQLDVPRRGKVPAVKFTLQSATATLVLDAPAAKGATIRVDEEDKGKVPGRVEVTGNDAHHVVVALGGKTLFDDYVNVGPGEEVPIAMKAGGSVVATKDPEVVVHEDDGGDRSGSGSDDVGVGKKSERSSLRFINIGGVLDIGFRSFKYEKGPNPTTNVRDESESGQLMAGIELELWPLSNASHLRGLSLFARYEHGFNSQPVMNANNLSTSWDTLEMTVRHRWSVGDTVALEGGGGFVRDSFNFTGDVAAIALTPDATYSSIRIGGRAVLRLGAVEPYVAAESRIVLSGGALQARFIHGASTSGYRAALGIGFKSGAVSARLEASMIRYGWTFTPEPSDTYRALSATDAVEVITATVGYSR